MPNEKNVEIAKKLRTMADVYESAEIELMPPMFRISTDEKGELQALIRAIGGKFKKTTDDMWITLESVTAIPGLAISIWRDRVCKIVKTYECEPLMSPEEEKEVMAEAAGMSTQPTLDLEHQKTAVQRQDENKAPATLLEAITQLAMNQAFDADKFEKILAMQERLEAQRKKELFDQALARAQQKMPRIEKNGVIDYGQGKGRVLYAKMEDIDALIRPIYTAEGFGVRWSTEPVLDGKLVKVTGYSSCGGHTEASSMAAPPDASGGKNATQAVPSANSYCKRQITMNFWNLITVGEDQDGARLDALKAITQDQADDLRIAIKDVPAINMVKFLALYKISKLEEMKAVDLDDAYKRIESVKLARKGK